MTFGWVTAVGNVRIQDFVELVAAAFMTGRAAPTHTATAAHMSFSFGGLTYTAQITGQGLVYDAGGTPLDGFIHSATIRDDAGNDLLYMHNFDIDVEAAAAAVAAEQLVEGSWALENYIASWALMYFSSGAGETILQGAPVGPDEWAFARTGFVNLHLSGSDDTVYLGANSDYVEAGGGNDTIFGGAGHDSIFSETGIDVIVPGAGNDSITADNEDTIVYSGRSTDYAISAINQGFLFVYMRDLRPNAPDGNDNIHVIFDGIYLEFADTTLVLTMVNGVPTLTPGVGVTINGSGGDDLISPTQSPRGQPLATGFADTIYGGAGRDSIDGGRGGDTMYGGAGDDTYYVDHQADLAVENGGGAVQGLQDEVIASVDYQLGDFIENLTFRSVALLGIGNGLDNRLNGSDLPNGLYGLDGNDTIDGKAGDDAIYGGIGNDLLLGGNGWDYIEGNDGDDITGADLVVYTGAALNSAVDARAYLLAAAGGTAGEGVFIAGTNAAGQTVLFHAVDASAASLDVDMIGTLGTLTPAVALQLNDFAFA